MIGGLILLLVSLLVLFGDVALAQLWYFVRSPGKSWGEAVTKGNCPRIGLSDAGLMNLGRRVV